MPMKNHQIFEPVISDYLSVLNESEVDEVIALYHGKEIKINKIIKNFDLERIAAGDFRKELPPSQCEEYVCPTCNVGTWIGHQRRGVYSLPYCPKCNVRMYEEYDPDARLKELERIQSNIERKRRIDINYYESELLISKTDFKTYSLEKKVVLGCMASVAISDDLSHIKGKLLRNTKFFPEGISNWSKFEHFASSNNYWDEARYNLESPLGKELILPQTQLGGTLEEQFSLWKKINLEEAKELLLWRSNHMGFFIKESKIVDEVLSSLLSEYSLGQVYKIIWSAVSQATDYYSQTNNRFKSTNSIIHNCQRSADYYKSRGWEINNFNRPSSCKQSQLSQYYFDAVLKIGDRGFYETASPNVLIHNSINFN